MFDAAGVVLRVHYKSMKRDVLFSQGSVLQYLGEVDIFLPRCMECRRGLAMRILSVCLSVKRVHCDKTEEKSVQIFYHAEDHLV